MFQLFWRDLPIIGKWFWGLHPIIKFVVLSYLICSYSDFRMFPLFLVIFLEQYRASLWKFNQHNKVEILYLKISPWDVKNSQYGASEFSFSSLKWKVSNIHSFVVILTLRFCMSFYSDVFNGKDIIPLSPELKGSS